VIAVGRHAAAERKGAEGGQDGKGWCGASHRSAPVKSGRYLGVEFSGPRLNRG
jgi:hypothetical protein